MVRRQVTLLRMNDIYSRDVTAKTSAVLEFKRGKTFSTQDSRLSQILVEMFVLGQGSWTVFQTWG